MKYIFFCFVVLCFACSDSDSKSAVNKSNMVQIIPQPQILEKKQKVASFSASLGYNSNIAGTENAFQDLGQFLKGNKITLIKTTQAEKADIVVSKDSTMARESYQLYTGKPIHIKAKDKIGVFYAIQTLKQLIPVNDMLGTLEIPEVKITDTPAWSYRGVHLDVARHFFSVEYIKKFITLLSQYKINRFHWHLTDDQGWRIEIKKYPKLHMVGGFRNETLQGHANDDPPVFDGRRYGGYYTQEEIRDIIQFANKKHITIIPEIDLPGHSSAILTAYPEYGCQKDSFFVQTRWGIFESVLCPYPETFAFLKDVLSEIMDLFPGPYIHLGGDEVIKTQWINSDFCKKLMREKNFKEPKEIESYFFNELARFALSKGKKPIGWDEITEFSDTPPKSIAMIWRSEETIAQAIDKKMEVILSPSSHLYLDYYQSMHPNEPLAIGGFLPLEKVYHFQPEETCSTKQLKFIKGVQANIWTEYIPTQKKLEYMALPRILALAELAWTKPSNKNYPNFQNRVLAHFNRLKAQGFNYSNSFLTPQAKVLGEGIPKLTFSHMPASIDLRYATGGEFPTAESPKVGDAISLLESTSITAQSFSGEKKVGFPTSIDFNVHKWTGAKVSLKHKPNPKYEGSGVTSFINGVKGSNKRYGDLEWLGFEGNNFEAELELLAPKTLDSLTIRYFLAPLQWIYAPKNVEVWYSKDGEQYISAGKKKITPGQQLVNEDTIKIKAPKARHWRITIENLGTIPKGKPGAGHQAFLFVDEITAH